MAQDYAKLRNRPAPREGRARSATRTTTTVSSTHWYWYFSGVFTGFFVIFIAYMGIGNFYPTSDTVTDPSIAEVSEREQPIFAFYNELANATVEVNTPAPANANSTASNPNNSATPATVASTEVATVTTDMREYLLQAGSFQDRADAESRRAKIILLNMNANIVPGVVAGRTWMRVQVGPFAGRQAAETARALLSENNIDSIPLLTR